MPFGLSNINKPIATAAALLLLATPAAAWPSSFTAGGLSLPGVADRGGAFGRMSGVDNYESTASAACAWTHNIPPSGYVGGDTYKLWIGDKTQNAAATMGMVYQVGTAAAENTGSNAGSKVAFKEIDWTATNEASVELKAICGAGGSLDKMWIATPVTLSKATTTTPAKCSTVKTTADFCGSNKVYDSSKDNTDCATVTCSKDSASDVAVCCKAKPKAEPCCSGINTQQQCICGSNTCAQGQTCSGGKCLHAEACPDGKTSEYLSCGCGGKDSEIACSYGEVCTASKKTCAAWEPPTCKPTFAALAASDKCKCGDRTCRQGHIACAAEEEWYTGSSQKGVCSYDACPSSGAATVPCSCKSEYFDNTCSIGQTCKENTCQWPVCPSSGAATEMCKCMKVMPDGSSSAVICATGRVCNLDVASSVSCEYPKCSATTTEECMCGTARCNPGLTCSADDAKENACGCKPSKDIYCKTRYDNDVAAGTCPNTCVGASQSNGGGQLGKCEENTDGSTQTICLKDGKSVTVFSYTSKDCSGEPTADKTQTHGGCITGSSTIECVYDMKMAAAAGDADARAEMASLESGGITARQEQLSAGAFAAVATLFAAGVFSCC